MLEFSPFGVRLRKKGREIYAGGGVSTLVTKLSSYMFSVKQRPLLPDYPVDISHAFSQGPVWDLSGSPLFPWVVTGCMFSAWPGSDLGQGMRLGNMGENLVQDTQVHKAKTLRIWLERSGSR